MHLKNKFSSKTIEHSCADPYCPKCGEFAKSKPPPHIEPTLSVDEMYPCWNDSLTVVVAHKRGKFGGSKKAADKWAASVFPKIYQTLHTARHFAWRVDKAEVYPQPKGFKK